MINKLSPTWNDIIDISISLLVSVVVGFVGGVVIAIIPYTFMLIVGEYMPIFLIFASGFTFAIGALVTSFGSIIHATKTNRMLEQHYAHLEAFFGSDERHIVIWPEQALKNPHTVKIIRSLDNKKQIRMNLADRESEAPGRHVHVERLDPATKLVIESYCILEPEPFKP